MTIRVPASRLAGGPLAWLTLARSRRPRRRSQDASRFVASFAFRNDERRFARRLVRRKSNLWVFRSNQRGFCGDFVVVDMSSPDPELRPVFVVDLKSGAPLKIGGGGASNQFKNAHLAVVDVAWFTGVIPPEASFELVSGDSAEILGYLCGASASVAGA